MTEPRLLLRAAGRPAPCPAPTPAPPPFAWDAQSTHTQPYGSAPCHRPLPCSTGANGGAPRQSAPPQTAVAPAALTPWRQAGGLRPKRGVAWAPPLLLLLEAARAALLLLLLCVPLLPLLPLLPQEGVVEHAGALPTSRRHVRPRGEQLPAPPSLAPPHPGGEGA